MLTGQAQRRKEKYKRKQRSLLCSLLSLLPGVKTDFTQRREEKYKRCKELLFRSLLSLLLYARPVSIAG
jgi:hypothetical protein